MMNCTLSLFASVCILSDTVAASGLASWPSGPGLVKDSATSVNPTGGSVARMAVARMGSPEEGGAADSTCGRQAPLNAALCVAATEGDAPATLALLLAGAEVNARVEGGPPPLRLAAGEGHTVVVRLLLAAGACRRPALSGGWTALHLAASAGLTEEVRELLASGADAGSKADDGATPLHAAARNGHASAALLLLEAEADAKARDACGDSPLHGAAARGQMETGVCCWLTARRLTPRIAASTPRCTPPQRGGMPT